MTYNVFGGSFSLTQNQHGIFFCISLLDVLSGLVYVYEPSQAFVDEDLKLA